MNKLILIVFIVLAYSCKKEKEITIPQSLIDKLSQECSNECKPQLHRVVLDGIDYIGLIRVPTGCDSIGEKQFFHKEGGGEIYYTQPRFQELSQRGSFAEALWTCN